QSFCGGIQFFRQGGLQGVDQLVAASGEQPAGGQVKGQQACQHRQLQHQGVAERAIEQYPEQPGCDDDACSALCLRTYLCGLFATAIDTGLLRDAQHQPFEKQCRNAVDDVQVGDRHQRYQRIEAVVAEQLFEQHQAQPASQPRKHGND